MGRKKELRENPGGGLWGREMCQGSPVKVGQRICQTDKNMSSLSGGKEVVVVGGLKESVLVYVRSNFSPHRRMD